MSSVLVPALVFAAILAVVHFFGEEIDEQTYPHQHLIASFAAGLTVAYIFLQLFPELHAGVDSAGNIVFLLSLGGFAVMHLTEKYIYHHDLTAEEFKEDFREFHSAFLFIYHLALGVIIWFLLQDSLARGILFFIPVLFHTSVSSLSLSELDEDIKDSLSVRIAVSSSVLLGVLIASLLSITAFQFYTIIATVTGMFLYVVISDSIRPGDETEPLGFLLGAVIYTLIILATWSLA